LIVGIKQDVFFEEKSMSLSEGDVILFYTDGLIEAENAKQEFFGLERVKAIFCQNSHLTPQAIIDTLFTALQDFCQRTHFDDDITLMVFKWH
jgi:phosphoserine phosphatase RsbU/P